MTLTDEQKLLLEQTVWEVDQRDPVASTILVHGLCLAFPDERLPFVKKVEVDPDA
jgi:hypothetical protein